MTDDERAEADAAELRLVLEQAVTDAVSPLEHRLFVTTLLVQAERCLNDFIGRALQQSAVTLTAAGATPAELAAELALTFAACCEERRQALATLRAALEATAPGARSPVPPAPVIPVAQRPH